MSDAEQNLDSSEMETTENVEQQQEVDYKALYEKAQKDLEVVAAKKDQLYNETKKAKQEREQAAKKELEIRRQQEEQAAKNGEFEKLWKQAQAELEQERQDKLNIKQGYKKEKIEVQAMSIANDLADGPNAKLLSKFVVESLNHLSDENGSLSDDVLQSVKEEFKNNEMYKALLRSSKATGGGAPGNMRGAQQENSIKKDAFYSMSDVDRQAHYDRHGKFNIED